MVVLVNDSLMVTEEESKFILVDVRFKFSIMIALLVVDTAEVMMYVVMK